MDVRTILDKINWNSKPPSPPPPQIKDEATRRAKTRHFPIFVLGGGGSGFSIYFVQDCSSAKKRTAVHFRQRKTITEKCPQLDLRFSYFCSFSGLLFPHVTSVFAPLDQRSGNVKPAYAVREEDSRYTRFEFFRLNLGKKSFDENIEKNEISHGG